jgi:hypothetical protein
MTDLAGGPAADVRHLTSGDNPPVCLWSINTSDCVQELGLSHRWEYHWDIGLNSGGQFVLEFQSRTINRHIFDNGRDGWMTIVEG